MEYLLEYDETNPISIETYGKRLIGKTFQDICDEDDMRKAAVVRETENYEVKHENKKRKGGLGELVEERYFHYQSNNDARPDFDKAGVELKVTPYKINKNGSISAKERLILTMIDYCKVVNESFEESHMWAKARLILLVYYLYRQEIKNRLDYKIDYVQLFSPPEEDMKIIEHDFNVIKDKICAGKAHELSEGDMFKGISVKDNYPYAQYYKGAFSYAEDFNHSSMSFVTGIQKLRPFQLNAPIVAGKPFFEYTKYYFDILADIQNNERYEGCFIKDNEIIKTLDLRKYKNGTGNRITRLMFDIAILLYVDRFCPENMSKSDTELLNRFVIYAFIWAYSMRAQYYNVGWLVAQNYIMETGNKVVNSYNIYKVINESDSPNMLLSRLSEITHPLSDDKVKAKKDKWDEKIDEVAQNYLYYFNKYNFWEEY